MIPEVHSPMPGKRVRDDHGPLTCKTKDEHYLSNNNICVCVDEKHYDAMRRIVVKPTVTRTLPLIDFVTFWMPLSRDASDM